MPKVRQEPNTSPLKRLIRPVPAIDMVITGQVSSFFALQVAERRVSTSSVLSGITAIFAISAPASFNEIVVGKNGFYIFFFCQGDQLIYSIFIRKQFNIYQVYQAGADGSFYQFFIL